MHKARIYRHDYSQGWSTPHHRWIFECHEIVILGHRSEIYVCGEGTYTTWERTLKSLRLHALGKHDFVL